MVLEPTIGRGSSGLAKPDFFLGKELQNNYSVIKKLNRMNTKHTFSILIWQVRYRLKNGKAPLSVRVSVNGERAEIRTNREIPPALWDAKAQRVKGATEEAKSINVHLETIKGSLRMHESRLIALGKTVNLMPILKETAAINNFWSDRAAERRRIEGLIEDEIRYSRIEGLAAKAPELVTELMKLAKTRESDLR